MKLNKFKSVIPAAVIALTATMSSCMADLDKGNINPNVAQQVSIQGLYNKCYAGLIMEGNDGAADFSIDDAGKSTLLRNIFNFNELSTDEAICWWSDGGIIEIGENDCSAGHATLKFLYYRLMSNITYCNQFLTESPDDNKTMNAEVRFLRAYYYYLMLDFFGDCPFIDKIQLEAPLQAHALNEKYDPSQTYTREQYLALGREFMFNWVEKELLAAETDMLDAHPEVSTEANYGRADKAAAWQLLSRLYLNAEVYIGKPMWKEAKDYAEKVITSDFKLFTGSAGNYTAYDMLFMGDNGESGASVEAVLPLLQDGIKTKGWGGSLFFVASLWNDKMQNVTGIDAGTTGNNWSGMRCRPQLIEKFTADPKSFVGKTTQEIRAMKIDDRALFWGQGNGDDKRTLELGDNSSFYQGLATTKWNNNYSSGASPHDSYDVDIDFFLLRVAEAYLNYVEADIRLNNGTCSETGKNYMNAIRSRAHTSEFSSASSITLGTVLDERSREFYMEGLRRTDLIRFGQFGGMEATYQWSYKGGNVNGVNFPAYRNVYPLPTSELSANSNLTQIAGYN